MTLPLEQCAAMGVETRQRFLHKETWIVIHSTGGIALEDKVAGGDADRLSEFCGLVSNTIAGR